MLRTQLLLTIAIFAALCGESIATTIVDFESVALPSSNGFGPFYNGADNAAGFTDHGVQFSNEFTVFDGGFTAWNGWAVSKSSDTTAGDFTNEYSSFAGGGASLTNVVDGTAATDPDSQFGVGFSFSRGQSRIELPTDSRVDGMFVTNGTYPALVIRDGNQFSKTFGGADGTDPDFFMLRVYGMDSTDTETGSVDKYLADYRADDSSLDYILDDWQWLDLTSLGSDVKSLEFELFSSDSGQFGINTPTYFLVDNLQFESVPEPSTLILLAPVLFGIRFVRRRSARRP